MTVQDGSVRVKLQIWDTVRPPCVLIQWCFAWPESVAIDSRFLADFLVLAFPDPSGVLLLAWLQFARNRRDACPVPANPPTHPIINNK